MFLCAVGWAWSLAEDYTAHALIVSIFSGKNSILLCYTLVMKKVGSSKSRKVRETKAKYRVDVRKESGMTLMEQIQNRLSKLSPDKQRQVLDFVAFLQLRPHTLPEPTTDAKRGRKIKELLNRLGTMKTFSEIADPVAWQRNTRKDRSLPGRAG